MISRSKSIFNIFTLFALLVSLLGSAIMVTPANANGGSTITVNTDVDELNADTDCSLREAISAANTNTAVDGCAAGTGADVITVPAGTYTLTIAGTAENVNVTGDLDVTDALTINGAGAGTTTIQAGAAAGSGIDRVIDILGAIAVSINNVTIANGKCTSCDGGGIFNNGGTLTMTNNTFSGNSAQQGGGIYNGVTVTVTNSTFSGNSAIVGGGIANLGTLTVTNSTISGNSATNNGGGISNNVAGTLTVTNSTLTGNSATSNGGGIVNYSSGILTVTNSTLTGNSAVNGGGIYNLGGTQTVTNSTFSGNSADWGGAIYNNSSILTIRNSTFSGNSASTLGGGIYIYSGTLTISNSILANSTSGTDCHLVTGTVSGTNNLIELDGSGINACGTTAPINSDPSLGVLTGSPAYFPLNIGSPAIDAGDDTICAAAPVNNTSQNGVTRPQGTHCDIGAFESPIILQSIGANDGWVLESTETSSVGGTMNTAATTFNLGDDGADKQYRALLHFDTSNLPDTAIITKVTLKIKKQGVVGMDPFIVLGGCLVVDMRKPSFGAVALAPGDFQMAAGRSTVAIFGVTPVSNWYSAVLNGSGRNYINKTGTTQFRLLFAMDDDNNNGADFMRFFSGNAGAASRPQLIIEYYML